jgi:diguanylate cyclase (GGDEF)-like protein
MAHFIDPLTMFLALLASTAAAVLLLLWCYILNRNETSLLWLGLGFLLTAASNLFLFLRGSIPEWLVVDVGGALIILGVGALWCAARAFNRSRVIPFVPLAGPVVWLFLCRVPAFYENLDARLVGVTVLAGVYYLVAAREFFARDGLVTRYALSAALAIHALFVFGRIPFVIMDDGEGMISFTTTPWFGIATLEGAIFLQVMSFLMVSLIKDRVESRLRSAALTDALTGLPNRRAFFEWAEAAIARGERSGRPVSAIVFDLDRFKEINDRYGHPVGDAVIQTFAAAARNRLRAGDFVARLGGEEFAVALPDTTGAEACLVALQINQAFEESVAAMAPGGLIGSACAGVAETSGPAAGTLDDLIIAADRALYEAKALGRGQVRLSEAPAPRLRVRAA